MSQTVKKPRLLEGLALIILGFVLIAPGTIAPKVSASASFASEPVEVKGLNTGEIDEKRLPSQIIIPAVGIDLPVERSQIINGYWEVPEDKAGWGEGSGLPGEAGNQVIFAHAQDGLFGDLDKVRQGDLIYVLTEGEWFLYKVSDIKRVYPNETEVIGPSEEEKLTLYTCSGYNDSMRLIVFGNRMN